MGYPDKLPCVLSAHGGSGSGSGIAPLISDPSIKPMCPLRLIFWGWADRPRPQPPPPILQQGGKRTAEHSLVKTPCP